MKEKNHNYSHILFHFKVGLYTQKNRQEVLQEKLLLSIYSEDLYGILFSSCFHNT